MRWIWRWALALTIVGAAAGWAVSALRPSEDYVVHEWGTFLAMAGSDGTTLEGMYHEEHALPDFVHARSRDQLRIPSVRLKGETPVIYFYTDQPRDVQVEVRFPTGIWTQWYPQAGIVGPQFSEARLPYGTSDGRIIWWGHLTPATKGAESITLPQTSSDALWNHARQVDAAFVQTSDYASGQERTEYERFLFYRGLGKAPLPLRFSAADGGTLQSSYNYPIDHIFILKIENGRGAFAYHPRLEPGTSLANLVPSMSESHPLEEFVSNVANDLARRLVESGLYEKEARAMVNTWRSSYFQTEGVRALVVMPQRWTDQFIPIVVNPQPKELVRVMVGRLELLTPERERRAEAAVAALASADAQQRENAFNYLREQGRYVEPIVRRIERDTKDQATRNLCRQLLATDFVTELRAAAQNATDRTDIFDDAPGIRAQLAVVLRQTGLDAQARDEGERALADLARVPEPALSHSDARAYLRAYARAYEAVGNLTAAEQSYARFIDFGAQVAARGDCRACHHDSGPKQMSWYRDWWAGRKYADLVRQRDGLSGTVDQLAGSSTPDMATRMKLAYLRDALGENDAARALWSKIESDDRAGQVAQGARRE